MEIDRKSLLTWWNLGIHDAWRCLVQSLIEKLGIGMLVIGISLSNFWLQNHII